MKIMRYLWTAAVAAVICGCVGTRSHYVCKVSEAEVLAHLNPRFPKAFEFLRRGDLATMKAGTYVLEKGKAGEKPALYAMVQDADLSPFEGETQHAEAHAKYIDIQMPISGDETYGFYDLDPSDPAFKLDESKDIGFVDVKTKPVTLKPGEFAVFLPPCGAHVPCTSLTGPRKIRKLVIKVRADE